MGPSTVTKQAAPNTGAAEGGKVLEIADTQDTFDYPTAAEVMTVQVTHVTGTQFKVTIADVSSNTALMTSEGNFAAPLSPGVWVVHGGENPLFSAGQADAGRGLEHIAEDGNAVMLGAYVAANSGITFPASPGVWAVHAAGTRPLFKEGSEDYGKGLQHIAEDGNPTDLGDNLTDAEGYVTGGVFNMPVGGSEPGPIAPGSSYQVTFSASPGEALSLATMLAATNDAFFAPSDIGIPLFDASGRPLMGDITDQIALWDAGTEANEQPGFGPNTVTHQPAPDTSEAGEQKVQLIRDTQDGFIYPEVGSLLKVTLSAQ